MTNLEWIRTLSEEEFADWLYDEWLHHLQYRWSSSRGGLIIWLKDRKTEPTCSKMEQVEEPKTQTETQNSNLTFEKDECAKEYEELGLKELKELIEADRKTENCSEKPNNSERSSE